MNGSAAQSIGANIFAGNTIKDLIINNSAGVTLLGPLNISGILTPQNGNLASDGNLTLLSTAAQTALISWIRNRKCNRKCHYAAISSLGIWI